MLKRTTLCFLRADVEKSYARLSEAHDSARIEAAHVCKLEKIRRAYTRHLRGSTMSIMPFSRLGSTGAMAARRTPLMRLTISVAPVSRAPVEPADTIASPSPFLSMVGATVMDASFLRRVAVLGSSSIVIMSRASTISISVSVLAEIFFYLFLAADEHKLDSEPVARIDRAFDYGFGRVIAAHCVNYYFHSRRPSFFISSSIIARLLAEISASFAFALDSVAKRRNYTKVHVHRLEITDAAAGDVQARAPMAVSCGKSTGAKPSMRDAVSMPTSIPDAADST